MNKSLKNLKFIMPVLFIIACAESKLPTGQLSATGQSKLNQDLGTSSKTLSAQVSNQIYEGVLFRPATPAENTQSTKYIDYYGLQGAKNVAVKLTQDPKFINEIILQKKSEEILDNLYMKLLKRELRPDGHYYDPAGAPYINQIMAGNTAFVVNDILNSKEYRDLLIKLAGGSQVSSVIPTSTPVATTTPLPTPVGSVPASTPSNLPTPVPTPVPLANPTLPPSTIPTSGPCGLPEVPENLQCPRPPNGGPGYEAINAGIEFIISEQRAGRISPPILDLNDSMPQNEFTTYRIVDPDRLHNMVTSFVRTQGFCAETGGGDIGVQFGPTHVIYYDIHLSSGYLWRGRASGRYDCQW